MEIAGKVCLVTGASSGIGEALAEQLAAAGAKVVAFARRQPELDRLVERAGSSVAAVAGDVTNADDLQRAVATAVDRFGGLDILVNNAGVAVMARLASVPIDVFEQGWRINVLGPVLALQAALPVLRQSRGAMVVNVSSAMSLRPSATMSIYSATKAALNILSASMREELRDENIQVLTVHPGFIANEFGQHTLFAGDVDSGPRMTPRSVDRTSADAARDIVDSIRDDRDVFRSNTSQPLTMPL